MLLQLIAPSLDHTWKAGFARGIGPLCGFAQTLRTLINHVSVSCIAQVYVEVGEGEEWELDGIVWRRKNRSG